ncbi:MAG: antitoxin [Actinomycetota bacterium]|nr:antitoxin [Actinomycetota bacterium]
MGIFDNISDLAGQAKDKAQELVDEHGDQVGDGLDKAGAFADEKTGGQHSDQIAQGVGRAKDGLDGLDGQDDDIR